MQSNVILMIAVVVGIILIVSTYNYAKPVILVDLKGDQSRVEKAFARIRSRGDCVCRELRREFPMVHGPDGDMDIAFTLVVHKDIMQIARLLRMIYRSNNYYCIHIDPRSPPPFVNALSGLATCFGANVELVPPDKRVEVNWGDESVLRPQLICGEQALHRHATWQYLINVVGQDFPLRTNLEIIAALKALNGSNLIEAQSADHSARTRNRTLPLNVGFTINRYALAHRRNGSRGASTGHSRGSSCTKPFWANQLHQFEISFFVMALFAMQMSSSSALWHTTHTWVCPVHALWHRHPAANTVRATWPNL